MPFYATKQRGDVGVFPGQQVKPVIADEDITPDTSYVDLTREQLIAQCHQRHVLNEKGRGVGKYQKKGYYINLLEQADKRDKKR